MLSVVEGALKKPWIKVNADKMNIIAEVFEFKLMLFPNLRKSNFKNLRKTDSKIICDAKKYGRDKKLKMDKISIVRKIEAYQESNILIK